MKVIIFTAIVVVILGTVWVLYLEVDQKRFEESLPKAPRQVSSQVMKDSPPMEPENIDSSHASGTRDIPSVLVIETEKVDITRREETTDAETLFMHPEEEIRHYELPHKTETEESSSLSAPQKPRGVSLVDWLASLSRKELEAVYIERPWLKPVDEMSLAEREVEVARQKQRLINTYGNTPEVRIINKYTTMESLMGNLSIPPEDASEYIRAISVLWPTDANVAAYENLNSLKKKNGM